MPPKASQNGAQIHAKINKNTDVLLVLFSIRLCIKFGINVDPTDPPFLCSRLGAVHILRFSQFYKKYTIATKKASKIGPKMNLKSTKNQQKINQISMSIFD